MRVRIQDREYELATDRITVFEARVLKKHTGMGFLELNDRLRLGDPDSVAAVCFLAKLRAGENPKWRDMDDLDLFADMEILPDAENEQPRDADDADEEGRADPTGTGTRTRTGGSTTTSRRSRSSSASTRGK